MPYGVQFSGGYVEVEPASVNSRGRERQTRIHATTALRWPGDGRGWSSVRPNSAKAIRYREGLACSDTTVREHELTVGRLGFNHTLRISGGLAA